MGISFKHETRTEPLIRIGPSPDDKYPDANRSKARTGQPGEGVRHTPDQIRAAVKQLNTSDSTTPVRDRKVQVQVEVQVPSQVQVQSVPEGKHKASAEAHHSATLDDFQHGYLLGAQALGSSKALDALLMDVLTPRQGIATPEDSTAEVARMSRTISGIATAIAVHHTWTRSDQMPPSFQRLFGQIRRQLAAEQEPPLPWRQEALLTCLHAAALALPDGLRRLPKDKNDLATRPSAGVTSEKSPPEATSASACFVEARTQAHREAPLPRLIAATYQSEMLEAAQDANEPSAQELHGLQVNALERTFRQILPSAAQTDHRKVPSDPQCAVWNGLLGIPLAALIDDFEDQRAPAMGHAGTTDAAGEASTADRSSDANQATQVPPALLLLERGEVKKGLLMRGRVRTRPTPSVLPIVTFMPPQLLPTYSVFHPAPTHAAVLTESPTDLEPSTPTETQEDLRRKASVALLMTNLDEVRLDWNADDDSQDRPLFTHPRIKDDTSDAAGDIRNAADDPDAFKRVTDAPRQYIESLLTPPGLDAVPQELREAVERLVNLWKQSLPEDSFPETVDEWFTSLRPDGKHKK